MREKKMERLQLLRYPSLEFKVSTYFDGFLKTEFLNKTFKDYLNYLLIYEEITLLTNIQVNVSEHFMCHFDKFLLYYYNVKGSIADINQQSITKEEKSNKKKAVYNELKKVKDDLI